MTDIFSQQKRSQVMQAVRSRGNRSTEGAFVDALREAGVTGWRRHRSIRLVAEKTSASGVRRHIRCSPDFVFPRAQVAVFLDGCFWHRCPWHGSIPVRRASFWTKKLGRNAERDKQINRLLRASGWHVIRIWEHRLKASPSECVNRLKRVLAAREPARDAR